MSAVAERRRFAVSFALLKTIPRDSLQKHHRFFNHPFLGIVRLRAAPAGDSVGDFVRLRIAPARCQHAQFVLVAGCSISSMARLIRSTLTRGSPSRPSVRFSTFSAITRRTSYSLMLRARATLGTWYSAAAGLMCGSRPLPDAVTRSIGTGDFSSWLTLRSASTRVFTASSCDGLVGP